jgi:hypothetical protein
MKKQLILVLAMSTILFTGCEEDNVNVTSPGSHAAVPNISSFYPESGPGGSVVAIFGENFGASIADNQVTFNGMYSEVTQVQPGTLIVRVPVNLSQGDYQINLSTQGQTVTSMTKFKVNNGNPTN